MLPRSEKFWVFSLVSFTLVLVLFFGVRAIQIFSGKEIERPPEYESLAPKKAHPPPQYSITDVNYASQPPISDRDFHTFHYQTRHLTDRLGDGEDPSQVLGKWMVDEHALHDAVKEMDALGALRDYIPTGPSQVSCLERPEQVDIGATNRTCARRKFAALDKAGGGLRGSLTLNFYWKRTREGWRIAEIKPYVATSTGSKPPRRQDAGNTPAE